MTTPFVTPVASSYHVVNPVTHVNPVAYGNKEKNDHHIASIDYSLLAQAQSTCPDVAVIRQSSRLRIVPRPVEGETLLGDVSTGVFRPLLPRAFRDEAIWFLHRGAHPGIRSTVKLVSSSFVWPTLGAWSARALNAKKVRCTATSTCARSTFQFLPGGSRTCTSTFRPFASVFWF